MTRVLALLAITYCASSLAAQAEDPTLEQKLQQKLAKSFVSSGGWVLDFDEAKRQAAKDNKLLFVYFTRTFAA